MSGPEPQPARTAEATVAAFLRARTEAIVDRWSRLGGADGAWPRERLEALVTQLASALEGPPGAALDGAALAGDAESVVVEYGRLRRALLEELAQLDRPAPQVLLRLHEVLDEAIARAAREATIAQRQILDAVEEGDAYFLVDHRWRITRVNRTQERMAARPRTQTLGRNLWEAYPELDDPRSPFFENYHRSMRERVPVVFEAYYAPLERWIEVSSFPTKDGGLAVFFRDVSARKRAEAALRASEDQLRQLFDAMNEGFALCEIVVDDDGKPVDYRHVRVNRAFTRLSGGRFTPESAQGKTARELAPNVEQYWIDLFGKVALTGEPATRLDYVAALDTWFNTRAFSLGAGRFAYIYEDVTAQKKAESALQGANERLVDAHRRKDELIGMMSHDLRSPLGAASMTAAVLLRREGHDERTVKGLVRIRNSIDRALKLIDTLLDFTHARLGGSIPVERTPTNLDEVLRSVLEDVQANFPERVVHFSGHHVGIANVDPLRFGQVVQNLVVNALKYSPAGTPVELHAAADDTFVTLDVHNEGEPIPTEQLPRLFQPMQRGERTGQNGGEPGLGLGLFIVDQLVRAHHGTIEVTSTREAGTTFSVRLPRAG